MSWNTGLLFGSVRTIGKPGIGFEAPELGVVLEHGDGLAGGELLVHEGGKLQHRCGSSNRFSE